MVCKRWTNTILITFWIYICSSHNQYPAFPKNHRNNWREKRKKENDVPELIQLTDAKFESDLSWSEWPDLPQRSELIHPLTFNQRASAVDLSRLWYDTTSLRRKHKHNPCRFRKSTLKRKLHKELPLFVTSPLAIFHLSCGLMMRGDVEFGVSGWIRVPPIYCFCLFQKCVNSTSCWPPTEFLFFLRLISSN